MSEPSETSFAVRAHLDGCRKCLEACILALTPAVRTLPGRRGGANGIGCARRSAMAADPDEATRVAVAQGMAL